MSRWVATWFATAALTVVLAGCGADDTEGADGSDASPFEPTGTPTEQVTMIEPPADYTEVEGTGFTISAPGEFQQERATSSNGEPMLVLEKPSEVQAVPERVAVIRDVEPVSPAVEQSFALESAKAAAGADGDVERIELPAPEGESAYLVSWQESVAAEGGRRVDVTYWQLMRQVGPDLIFNVVAFAPSSEFESSEVSRILRTFEPGSSA